MTIQLKPEQERFIHEEIQNGHFQSPDEVLDHALAALREKNRQPKSLVQFFRESPFVGMEMKFERSQDAHSDDVDHSIRSDADHYGAKRRKVFSV